jgi:hypothetical protein
MKSKLPTIAALLAVLFMHVYAGAATDAPASKTKITVAVLDFESAAADLGKQVADATAAKIGKQGDFDLVDRASLSRSLQETELNLTGLIDPDKAVKIGKLVGARLLITGRAAAMDKNLVLTAKIISVETSRVEIVSAEGEQSADTHKLVDELADNVAARLKEAGPKLLGTDSAESDPIPALKEKLASRALPKVAIRVTERHVSGAPAAHVDPAVDTELSQLFQDCGFTVVQGDEKKLADEGVELIIGGEAFSEFAARIGNLVSCSARVELKVTNRKSGELILSDRTTVRATDLSENIAGKTALEKGGRELGVKIIEKLAAKLRAKSTTQPAMK